MTGDELRQIAENETARRKRCKNRVGVCMAAGCQSLGAERVKAALESEAQSAGRGSEIEVHGTGCLGLCHAGTMVSVESSSPDGTPSRRLYERVDALGAAELVSHLVAGGPEPADRRVPADAPFLAKQTRIVLSGSGEIDPERIESCIASGAYSALERTISEMTPAQVIQEITASGLRGRGGGGYPTGLKWATVAKAAGARKYVICNGDEGDPGAFMDRSVLEGDPHRVLEGMAIAAYAVGAASGYIYVRAEYPLAVKRLRNAIQEAEKLHLLGNRIFDSAFDFRIDVRIGAGAFVCGEETALIASVEGKRGSPRPRPPYPAASGLWGMPTLINNVETYANVPAVVTKGASWFSSIGTAKSKGTKVFALAGKIRNTGLIEVPIGITLREIVFDVGGGIPGGKKFKAAQTGGPSGGCIPAHLLDLPVDYDSLLSVGTMMGSGGLIIMDETSCMVDVARFFMEFCRDESCGKCVPCRTGTVQMHRILERITRGEGRPEDLDRLAELAELMGATSLCGLGQSAPSPVLSTMRWFRDEYEAHVKERRCPAGVCTMKAPAVARPSVREVSA